MKSWPFVLGACVIVFGLLFFVLKDINKVTLTQLEVHSVSDVSAKGFTLQGNLHVSNPVQLPLPVTSVTYGVYVKETAKILASGKLDGFTLKRRSVTVEPFRERVDLSGESSLLSNLARENQVFIVIEGDIKIDIIGLIKYNIHFLQEHDIKPSIASLGPEIIPSIPIDEENRETLVQIT